MVQTKLNLENMEKITTDNLVLYAQAFKAMQDVKTDENEFIIDGLTKALIRLINNGENVIKDGEFKL